MRKMQRTPSITFLVFHFFFFLLFFPTLNSAADKEAHSKDDHINVKVGPSHTMDKLENWVKIFEHTTRDEWQEPEKVIKMMKLKNGYVVADIGAGTGYFTRKFAKAVGPNGRAIGVDIEPELVQYMKEDAQKSNLKNYEAILAEMKNSTLEPGSVDVVFICITYHHIDNRVAYMRNLLKVFKKGGRVIFVEFYKKKMVYGPPSNHKISKEKVIEELEEAGYRLTGYLDFLKYQYFLEFEPVT